MEIAAAAVELARAVEVTMDPSAPQHQRMDAYTACENFKELSPLCAQCGFYLAQNGAVSHVVRHFGLQLIEHCVKFRWNQISQEEKLFIKDNVMKLLCGGAAQQELTHIKDALSRVVVEMIKREWPQQWPGLLTELSNACKLGANQTELVLLVFLRLVEDVALLKTLESNQRRKDIYQALTTNMAEIFSFFLKIIEEHYRCFQRKLDLGQTLDAAPHLRVVNATLLALTGFLDWVAVTHIMAEDGRLLQVLCVLLERKECQMMAAECLQLIANRKGRTDEQRPLLVLFSHDVLSCMLRSLDVPYSNMEVEQQYLFFKKLAQVLNGMATLLCAVWGKGTDSKDRPLHFSLFLSIIIRFTTHVSITLAHSINSVWMSFFKHSLISKDQVLLEYVPRWLPLTASKIVTVRHLSRCSSIRESTDVTTAAYLYLDYASDEDFTTFFHRCRMDMLETIRQATLIAPLVTFYYVEEWLIACLSKAVAEPVVDYSLIPASFSEWEGLSLVLESVMSRVLLGPTQPNLQSCLRMLELCVNYEPSHPLLLHTLLSCILALFVFLSAVPNDEISAALLPRVLDKVFAALIFTTPGLQGKSVSHDVKHVRRHASSFMLKISNRFPQLLLPMFERIFATVQRLTNDQNWLLQLENASLQEALVCISNHFCDYERQTRFIEEVIRPGSQKWLTIGSVAFIGPQEFVRFVGMDRPLEQSSDTDLYGQNCLQIQFCINLFLAVTKQTVCPTDVDRGSRGGFFTTNASTGAVIIRNPATPHITPLLPNVLALLRIFNTLWTPAAVTLLSDGYRPVFTTQATEHFNLPGFSSPPQADIMDGKSPHTPLDRMRNFVKMVHENCLQILGSSSSNLGRDFYGLTGLAPSILESVFSNLEVIPYCRMRPIILSFLNPFVSHCPPEYYESVVLPILARICPFMFQRLNNMWQCIAEKNGMVNVNSEEQEVLEDALNRTLTREYLDVLKVALMKSVAPSAIVATMETEHNERNDISRLNSLLHSEVSELGSLILHNETICQSVALCILRALSWNDTMASWNAAFLAAPVVRFLFGEGSLTPPVAAHIMTSVLQGLELHGQHESNNSTLLALGVHVYEVLRPSFPNILDVMMQIPSCTARDLERLDEKIATSNQKNSKVDKSKKDIFKRITSKLVGPSMGKLFRKEVCIADLPRVEVKRRSDAVPLDMQPSEDGILSPLFALAPKLPASGDVP